MEENNFSKENTKYIRRSQGKYQIVKSISGKRKYFGTYSTLKEAMDVRDELVSKNWGLPKEDKKIKPKKQRKIGKYGKYIALHNGYYKVHKLVDGKQKFFGAFNTPEEAKQLRDLLIENDWDETKLPDEILEKFHISKELARHNYIRKVKGKYVVCKVIDGDLKYFGTYDTKSQAIEMRDELIKSNWNMNNYTEEKIDEYVYQIDNEFIVRKEIDGSVKIFGRFDEMGDALKFRNECIRTNWKL